MRTVLVTGGAGFIGTYVALTLLARDFRVRILALPCESADCVGDLA